MHNYLIHHGIKGQQWGVQNGPPYPLSSDISTGKRLKKEQKKFAKKVSNYGTKNGFSKVIKSVEKDTLQEMARRVPPELIEDASYNYFEWASYLDSDEYTKFIKRNGTGDDALNNDLGNYNGTDKGKSAYEIWSSHPENVKERELYERAFKSCRAITDSLVGSYGNLPASSLSGFSPKVVDAVDMITMNILKKAYKVYDDARR